MAAEQIAVRVPKELLRAVDQLVTEGIYESRAAAVRAGMEAIMALQQRERTDRGIVAGYERIPARKAETAAAMASLRDAIAEEPW